MYIGSTGISTILYLFNPLSYDSGCWHALIWHSQKNECTAVQLYLEVVFDAIQNCEYQQVLETRILRRAGARTHTHTHTHTHTQTDKERIENKTAGERIIL